MLKYFIKLQSGTLKLKSEYNRFTLWRGVKGCRFISTGHVFLFLVVVLLNYNIIAIYALDN